MPSTWAWKETLPDNDLSIFDGSPDVKIEKLGEFSALNGNVIRPMYKALQINKGIQFGNPRTFRSKTISG